MRDKCHSECCLLSTFIVIFCRKAIFYSFLSRTFLAISTHSLTSSMVMPSFSKLFPNKYHSSFSDIDSEFSSIKNSATSTLNTCAALVNILMVTGFLPFSILIYNCGIILFVLQTPLNSTLSFL